MAAAFLLAAGGKAVNADKVVCKVIRDAETKMNALSKGEMDGIALPSRGRAADRRKPLGKTTFAPVGDPLSQ